jgi:hypothetical protein
MTKRRTAPEIIAFHLGWDMSDVSEGRYQSTRIVNPGVYLGPQGDYYCSPTAKQKLPVLEGLTWEKCGNEYGRDIYSATA